MVLTQRLPAIKASNRTSVLLQRLIKLNKSKIKKRCVFVQVGLINLNDNILKAVVHEKMGQERVFESPNIKTTIHLINKTVFYSY